MMTKILNKTLAVITAFTLLIASILLVQVEPTNARGNEITVSPAALEIRLSEPNQLTSNEIKISNSFGSAMRFSLRAVSVDTNQPNLIPKESLDDNIKDAISLPESEITIPANDSKIINVVVKNTDQLSPGGQYASLVLSQINTETASVNLNSAINISLYIVKTDGAVASLSLEDSKTNGNIFMFPSSAYISLKNDGNVKLTPRGTTTVRSMDGKTVYAKGIMNENSRFVLPRKDIGIDYNIETIRSKPKLPTKLQIITEFRADGVALPQYAAKTIWYIPMYLLASFVLFILLFSFIIYKLFNKLLTKRKLKKKKKNTKPKRILISDVIAPEPKSKE